MEDIGEGVVFNSQTVAGFENTDGYVGIPYRITDGYAR